MKRKRCSTSGPPIKRTRRRTFWPSLTLTRIPGITDMSSQLCRFHLPGNIGNEPHHCHLNSTKTVLGCGGLLSLLKGQNGIFFFDVTDAKKPRFMFSTKAVESSMTDDFLPLENGGFLITQMGSATGMAPGRVAEFDGRMHFVANHFGPMSFIQEWPSTPPVDGFNPHGISARPDLNLMMTSDFIMPSSTLMGSMGPVLRGSVRIW